MTLLCYVCGRTAFTRRQGRPHCGRFHASPPAPDAARSAFMKNIKPTRTKPEERLARAFRKVGLRPKRHDKLRPGTPDFSFPRLRLAVFVDGDFWHGRGGVPKKNRAWWLEKFRKTRARDRRADCRLRAMGWTRLRLPASAAKGSEDRIAAFVLGTAETHASAARIQALRAYLKSIVIKPASNSSIGPAGILDLRRATEAMIWRR